MHAQPAEWGGSLASGQAQILTWLQHGGTRLQDVHAPHEMGPLADCAQTLKILVFVRSGNSIVMPVLANQCTQALATHLEAIEPPSMVCECGEGPSLASSQNEYFSLYSCGAPRQTSRPTGRAP